MINVISIPKIKLRLLAVGLIAICLACLPPTQVNAARARGYSCGSQCNGQYPDWENPDTGIRCSRSTTQVAEGHPTGTYQSVGMGPTDSGQVTEIDTSMTIKVMYSKTCQTMWAVLTNYDGNGRTFCDSYLHRSIKTTWDSPGYGCPNVGISRTTRMVDDHSRTNGIAADITISELLTRKVCAQNPSVPDVCNAQDQSVTFKYTFAY